MNDLVDSARTHIHKQYVYSSMKLKQYECSHQNKFIWLGGSDSFVFFSVRRCILIQHIPQMSCSCPTRIIPKFIASHCICCFCYCCWWRLWLCYNCSHFCFGCCSHCILKVKLKQVLVHSHRWIFFARKFRWFASTQLI